MSDGTKMVEVGGKRHVFMDGVWFVHLSHDERMQVRSPMPALLDHIVELTAECNRLRAELATKVATTSAPTPSAGTQK